MKILLLEDNKLFASSLKEYLELEDFDVFLCQNVEELYEVTFHNSYDIYLFDINLPTSSGLEALKSLRDSSDNTPCIFLTSYKDKDILKDAFKIGADDYMVKPFDEDELILRIYALLKRSNKIMNSICINNIEYNINTNTFTKDNQELNVSKKVIDLFVLFYENKDKIITKEMIINKLWNTNENYSEGSIRVYISKLKDILGSDTIVNIKGQGYKIQF
jgi:DNA-binding response OmpR family regulator